MARESLWLRRAKDEIIGWESTEWGGRGKAKAFPPLSSRGKEFFGTTPIMAEVGNARLHLILRVRKSRHALLGVGDEKGDKRQH